MVPVDMGTVVELALGRLVHMVDESGAVVKSLDSWPQASGYAPWLEEVWMNYLSNGIKYGGRPPRLELGAEAQPDGMTASGYWTMERVSPRKIRVNYLLSLRVWMLSVCKGMGLVYRLCAALSRSLVDRLASKVRPIREVYFIFHYLRSMSLISLWCRRNSFVSCSQETSKRRVCTSSVCSWRK